MKQRSYLQKKTHFPFGTHAPVMIKPKKKLDPAIQKRLNKISAVEMVVLGGILAGGKQNNYYVQPDVWQKLSRGAKSVVKRAKRFHEKEMDEADQPERIEGKLCLPDQHPATTPTTGGPICESRSSHESVWEDDGGPENARDVSTAG